MLYKYVAYHSKGTEILVNILLRNLFIHLFDGSCYLSWFVTLARIAPTKSLLLANIVEMTHYQKLMLHKYIVCVDKHIERRKFFMKNE